MGLYEGDMGMDYAVQDAFGFFDRHQMAFPIYEAFVRKLFELFPQTSVRVQKTQITFSNRHVYACISFMRVKKRAEKESTGLTVTLGLPFSLESDRVAVKTEPYPGRWTTHIWVGSTGDLDDELFDWVRQAYEYALNK